jgi:hypothetical protein
MIYLVDRDFCSNRCAREFHREKIWTFPFLHELSDRAIFELSAPGKAANVAWVSQASKKKSPRNSPKAIIFPAPRRKLPEEEIAKLDFRSQRNGGRQEPICRSCFR